MLEKERLIVTKTPEGKQKVIRRPENVIPKEVESWIEKVEKGEDLQLTKPVTNDDTGQVLVTAPSAKKQRITLPMDKSSFVHGLTQGFSEAIRWLSEFCLKLIKTNPERVQFKKKDKK